MLSYRHLFHAGNFADVFKHTLLTHLLLSLNRKDKPYFFLDTHAGIGRYDLSHPWAQKVREYESGISRLRERDDAPAALQPYLDIVRGENADGHARYYPGSPLIVRHLLRAQDRLSAIELHPEDASTLKALFSGDHQVRVIRLDGWLALGAHVPPKERRGLVLVDPPFEEEGELARLADRFQAAWRRWPGGIYALWYPIKDRAGPDQLAKRLSQSAIPAILRAELSVDRIGDGQRLTGSGLVIVNPPWKLAAEMGILGPALAAVLGRDGRGQARLDWLKSAP